MCMVLVCTQFQNELCTHKHKSQALMLYSIKLLLQNRVYQKTKTSLGRKFMNILVIDQGYIQGPSLCLALLRKIGRKNRLHGGPPTPSMALPTVSLPRATNTITSLNEPHVPRHAALAIQS